jgi:2-polyprenyl-3-methyl-5-hydroxy-6-metoxy-1,4-benzoquinol methylase
MGTSHPESRPWAISKILSVNPGFILDIGAGSGTYADALKNAGYSKTIDAVEVWPQYIEKYYLKKKYRNVFHQDVRTRTDFDYDVVIFGDILEHMTKEEAVKVW